jgi:hypothetical protein
MLSRVSEIFLGDLEESGIFTKTFLAMKSKIQYRISMKNVYLEKLIF